MRRPGDAGRWKLTGYVFHAELEEGGKADDGDNEDAMGVWMLALLLAALRFIEGFWEGERLTIHRAQRRT